MSFKSDIRHKWICAKSSSQDGHGLRYVALAACVVFGMSSLGCSTTLSSKKSETQYVKRIRHLEAQLRRKQAEIADLKERNLVLEKRRLPASQKAQANVGPDSVPIPFYPSAAREKKSAVRDQKLLQSPLSKDVVSAAIAEPNVERVGKAQTGEHFLYSKILESYRDRKEGELEKSIQLLLKTYPDSVFADNALYLAGRLAMENKDFKKALRFMDQVLAKYPHGNKAVSALFAKGMIYKAMNNTQMAQRTFTQVRKQYPGSPESVRVTLEMKLLKAQAKKREL